MRQVQRTPQCGAALLKIPLFYRDFPLTLTLQDHCWIKGTTNQCPDRPLVVPGSKPLLNIHIPSYTPPVHLQAIQVASTTLNRMKSGTRPTFMVLVYAYWVIFREFTTIQTDHWWQSYEYCTNLVHRHTLTGPTQTSGMCALNVLLQTFFFVIWS